MTKISILLTISLFLSASIQIFAQKTSEKTKSKDWIPLLDETLSKWEVWTGVPQPTVQNLPASYIIPADGVPVKPLGLGDRITSYNVCYTKLLRESGDR